MKLALAGLFLCLAVVLGAVAQRTGDMWFGLGAAGFAVASIASSSAILSAYKGGKRQ